MKFSSRKEQQLRYVLAKKTAACLLITYIYSQAKQVMLKIGLLKSSNVWLAYFDGDGDSFYVQVSLIHQLHVYGK